MRRPAFALVLLVVATMLANGPARLGAQGAASRRARPVKGAVAVPPPPSFAATLDREGARWVEATLKSLDDDALVGQLLMGRLDSTYLSADSAKFETLAELVRDVHIGGFCAFGGVDLVPAVMLNATYGATILGQPLELAAILNRLQTLSTLPLLVSGDFEHGVGMRINGATRFPRAMAFGAAGDPALVREAARLTAVESRAIGVHVNFAPVADVNNNPRNPVINIRSFGEDPTQVGVLVRAAVEGLQSGGVVATLKHFPGHGDTAVDTHLGLATVPHDRARLDRVELPPFRDGIGAGAGAAMVAHVEMPALDPVPGPATFSRPIVAGLLRRDLEFAGVIYTDSMRMDAVNALADPGEGAVRAVEAGVDIVLDPLDVRAAAAGLKAALAKGRLTRARLEDSARRVLTHKARLGLHRTRTVNLESVMTDVGTRAAADTAQAVAEKAVTLLRDERASVPLPAPRSGRILYLSVLDYSSNWRIAAPSRTLLPELRTRWANVTAVEVTDRTSADELDLVRAMAGSYDAVVAGIFVRASSGSGRLDLGPNVVRLLQDLSAAAARRAQPVAAVFFGSPYAAVAAAALPAVLITYDFGDFAEAAAVRALAGEIPIQGKLPVALGDAAGVGFGLTRTVPAISPQ
ncbi:MAG TPA: glycoside hydrolase family 3 protein [Vicinamibacterales bacterium]|nr:glycoside hydrolase family 3 protein [Vicinamibacterales bacterium]